MRSLEDILQKISEYNPDADIDLVRKAYVFSAKVHEGQTRRSGEPYLTHPLEVAGILADMRLDTASIATGLLHDTVEDTLATLDEIEEIFGPDIRRLVDSVTKLSKINFKSHEEQQAETFRKMFIAMAEDIRVILVKLCDRLHNMRTLKFLKEEKQMRIAQETLDIYAPIAGRLGMQELKIELENLCFLHLKPDVWDKIDDKIENLKKNSARMLEDVEKDLRAKLKEQNIEAQVQSRIKHPYSIYCKMEEQNIEFEQVFDLVALRVIVNSLQQCYEALGICHSLWRPVPGRFKDYIGMPKANNYQSLHTTVIGLGGQRVEFQIRTREMHEIAEWGIASHWKYKEQGKIANKDEIKFRWLRQFMEWQKELLDPAEYLDTVRLDLFASEVYVFTPKGDVREFPHGSSPIDFAYAVHSDVGQHCVGARVNGKIVPLKYRLRSGDVVEIITSAHQRPSKDWLNIAHTSRAKAKIRHYLQEQEKENSHILGEELLVKEFKRYGEDFSKHAKKEAFEQYLRKNGYQKLEQILEQVSYGKITPHQVAAALLPADKLKEGQDKSETTIGKIFRKVFEKTKGAVQVGGFEDILVTFGKCCNPIPGEGIIGFITRGRGVTVHAVNCSKVLASDPARRVDVNWDPKAQVATTTRIRVICVDKPGLLADISKSISALGVNISNASCRATDDQKSINTFEVNVENLTRLHSVIKSVEKIKGVISVERVRNL